MAIADATLGLGVQAPLLSVHGWVSSAGLKAREGAGSAPSGESCAELFETRAQRLVFQAFQASVSRFACFT
jgi:hypothetical protein